MSDQNGRAILPVQYELGLRHRIVERCQGVLHGRHVQTRGLQARDHFGPGGSVREQPVDQNDVSSRGAVRGIRQARRQRSHGAGRKGGSKCTTSDLGNVSWVNDPPHLRAAGLAGRSRASVAPRPGTIIHDLDQIAVGNRARCRVTP